MYFQYGKHADEQWYWRLRAANHEIIAHGEGYYNRSDCLHVIELVKNSGDSPTKEE